MPNWLIVAPGLLKTSHWLQKEWQEKIPYPPSPQNHWLGSVEKRLMEMGVGSATHLIGVLFHLLKKKTISRKVNGSCLETVPASHHTLVRWIPCSCLFPAWMLWPPAPSPPSSFSSSSLFSSSLIPVPFKHRQTHYLWRSLISNASIMPGKTLTIYLMSTDMMIHKRWFQSKWASLICCEPSAVIQSLGKT